MSSQYDKIDLKETKDYKREYPPESPEPPEATPFDCEFEEGTDIVRDYHEGLCVLVIMHGRAGYFFESFAGRFNICPTAMFDWISEKDSDTYVNFRSSVKIAMSACLHFWNCKLIHALDNFAILGDIIPTVRAMIKDLTGSMPKELRNMQFENLVSPDTPEEAKRRAEMKRSEEEYNLMRGTENV